MDLDGESEIFETPLQTTSGVLLVATVEAPPNAPLQPLAGP